MYDFQKSVAIAVISISTWIEVSIHIFVLFGYLIFIRNNSRAQL